MKNDYGFTEYEAEHLSRGVVRIPKQRNEMKEVWETIAVALIAIAMILTIFHFTLEQKIPVAHAETNQLSDYQQEREYCAEVFTGTPIVGGTMQQIRKHCQKYID